MSNYFEELREKAVKKAVMETEKRLAKEAQKVKEEVALNVLKLGKLSFEEIADCLEPV